MNAGACNLHGMLPQPCALLDSEPAAGCINDKAHKQRHWMHQSTAANPSSQKSQLGVRTHQGAAKGRTAKANRGARVNSKLQTIHTHSW